MKQKLLLGFIMILLLASCKKDKDDDQISLKGKWTIDNIIVKEYENNVLIDTDIESGDGTTFDFQNNGHLIISSPGSSPESVPYTLQPNSKVDIDGDVAEIKNLTSSTVTLFLKEDYGGGDYFEASINMKR